MRYAFIFWMMLAFFLNGCLGKFVHGGKEYLDDLDLSSNLPKEWYKYNGHSQEHKGWEKFKEVNNLLILTRTGFWMQQILIYRVPNNTPLIHTQQISNGNMLPEKLAAWAEANILAHPKIQNPKILSKGPVMIANQAGYKLVYTYEETNFPGKLGRYIYDGSRLSYPLGYDRLTYQVAEYGFHYRDWFYNLIYVAPARHYFARDLPAFEAIKEDLVIGRDPSIPAKPMEQPVYENKTYEGY